MKKRFFNKALTVRLLPLASLIILILTSCSRELYYPNEEILEKTLNVKNIKIHENRKYNILKDKPLENIVLYSNNESYFLALYHKKDKRLFNLIDSRKIISKEYSFLKMAFIKPATSYSQILLFFKKENDPFLMIIDWEHFNQKIPLTMEDLSSIQILKNKKKPGDEYLLIQDRVYRYDSMQYIETFLDSPMLFFRKLDLSMDDKENPSIILQNIGTFTARSVFTMSFPDLNNANFHQYIKINKRISGMRFYSAGRKIHHADVKNYYSKYPMIEVTSPLKNMKTLKMYIHAKKGSGRIQLRAVVQKAGRVISWPPLFFLEKEYNQGQSDARVVQDQQGYAAYEIMISDE